MEPLSTALIVAFASAAQALLGRVSDAAVSDLWDATKQRLAGLARLDTCHTAVDIATREALTEYRSTFGDDLGAHLVLALLEQSPELLRLAIEDLLLTAHPNPGRLLDLYRRDLRFAALRHNQQLPDWPLIELPLHAFISICLPAALAKQSALHRYLLDNEQLEALDAVRSIAQTTHSSSQTLERIEALLRELVTLPQISQTITTGEGSTISEVKIVNVQGNAYAIPAVSAPDLDTLYRQYRAYLVRTYAALDFRGIVQVQNVVRLRLEAVYVPLKSTTSVSQSMRIMQQERSDTNTALVKLYERTPGSVSLHDLIRDTPYLLVLGDPGTGKSTLMRYLLVTMGEGKLGERLGLNAEWLPIMFPVAAFAEARERDGDLAPLAYLTTFYKGQSQPAYHSLFERALLGGRALVLFDGLDEVRSKRLTMVRCLEAFVSEWEVFGNRFIATSRIAGYDDAPIDASRFVRATVVPFDDADIMLFTQQWALAYEQAGGSAGSREARAEIQRKAYERSESLRLAIFATENVTALARNPLLLTILALIHHQGTSLPNRRVDLYRLCVEALAETWNRARSLSGREIDVYLGEQKLDERFVVNLLGPSALWIHQENPGGLVEERDLEHRLTETLMITDGLQRGKAQRLAGEFIDLVKRETGLLQERGHKLYSFLHLTFEEYLAARALVDSAVIDDAEDRLHRYACDPDWREVVRLALASQQQREAQRLLLHLLIAPTAAETYGRPIILAGECLLDLGRNGATQRAWNAVIEHLVALIGDPPAPIAIRVEAGNLLGTLGDPRLLDVHIGNAPDGQYWCAIEPGPFWFGDDRKSTLQRMTIEQPYRIARFAVTNAEYARFMADDGYNPDAAWWQATPHGRSFLLTGGHQWNDKKQFITQPRYLDDQRFNNPTQPVVGVSWYEAAAYCRWLTIQGHQFGWLPMTNEIRLPTAREWERAARGTDQRRYPWGNTEPTPEFANYAATQIRQPSPVGCFPSGRAACGAQDLAGNVLEWLATPYQKERQGIPAGDPAADEAMLLTWSYYGGSNVEQIFCGVRDWGLPDLWDNYQGFRVVWSLCSSVSVWERFINRSHMVVAGF